LHFALGVGFASGIPRAASFALFASMFCSRCFSYSLTSDCSGGAISRALNVERPLAAAAAAAAAAAQRGGERRGGAALTLAAEPLGPSCSVDPGGVSATVGSAPPRRSRGALAAVPPRPRRFGDGTAALWRRYRGALATVPPRLATLWRRCAALLATPGEAHRRPSQTAAPTVAGRGATVAAATLERRRASPNTGKTSAVARRADVFGANLHGTGFTFARSRRKRNGSRTSARRATAEVLR